VSLITSGAAAVAVAADPEPSVKLAALSSLTHLVLGGMVKAKGNVAKVAMLLVDDNQGNCHAMSMRLRLQLAGVRCMA
jgi:hypothetical protein